MPRVDDKLEREALGKVHSIIETIIIVMMKYKESFALSEYICPV